MCFYGILLCVPQRPAWDPRVGLVGKSGTWGSGEGDWQLHKGSLRFLAVLASESHAFVPWASVIYLYLEESEPSNGLSGLEHEKAGPYTAEGV